MTKINNNCHLKCHVKKIRKKFEGFVPRQIRIHFQELQTLFCHHPRQHWLSPVLQCTFLYPRRLSDKYSLRDWKPRKIKHFQIKLILEFDNFYFKWNSTWSFSLSTSSVNNPGSQSWNILTCFKVPKCTWIAISVFSLSGRAPRTWWMVISHYLLSLPCFLFVFKQFNN